jgi:hypothetical protein
MAELATARTSEGENLSLGISSFVVREKMAAFTEHASLCILKQDVLNFPGVDDPREMRRPSFKYHLKYLTIDLIHKMPRLPYILGRPANQRATRNTMPARDGRQCSADAWQDVCRKDGNQHQKEAGGTGRKLPTAIANRKG